MKQDDQENQRYPQSAELFRFCKEALSIKHNFEVKVIDQHVGAILGFDPADCSHWKKGKKNIKSLQTVNTIASHLQVDPRLISDLIKGRADLAETIQEFKGYGPTQPSQKFFEELKRDYFRNPAKFAVNGQSKSIDEVTKIDVPAIQALVDSLLKKADVSSCPVMLPEILAIVPDIKLEIDESQIGESVQLKRTAESWVIRVATAEMRPHLRFMIAKSIAKALLIQEQPSDEPQDMPSELAEAKANQFALLLLMPTQLFALAMREIDDSRDIIQQLAETFWMSRSLVNLRLKDYFRSQI